MYSNYYNQGGIFSVGAGHLDGALTPAPIFNIFNFMNGTTTLIVKDNSTLNREKLDTYKFHVTAERANCPENGVRTATVLITLTDENDNAPMIIEPPV